MEIKNATILEHLKGGGVFALIQGPASSIKIRVEPANDPFVRVFPLDERGQVNGYTLGAVVDGTLLWATDERAVCDEDGKPVISKEWWNPATGNPAAYCGNIGGWMLGE